MYMFDKHHGGKIKNEKFLRWRLELSCFSFDIVYRPSRDNIPADKLSRATCAMVTEDYLFKLHEALCHPGVTRLNHFVQTKNLPYSLDEIKKMTSPVCCECKPQFHRQKRFPLSKPLSHSRGSTLTLKALFRRITETNTSLWLSMSTSGFHLFSHVLMCPRTQSLSALHRCSHLLECQPMSIQTVEPHL